MKTGPDLQDLLVCAAFLAIGFEQVVATTDSAVYEKRTDGLGQVEVIARLVENATIIEQAWLDMSQELRDNWGTVWAYEVVEKFGIAWTEAFFDNEPWNTLRELERIIIQASH